MRVIREGETLPPGWLAPLLAALGGVLLAIFLHARQPIAPGEYYASQGSAILPPDVAARFPYNSSPPTSGARIARLPATFVLDTPLSPPEQVNVLAYGNVLVQCNDACPRPSPCPMPRAELVALARLYDNEPVELNLRTGHGVVVAPSPALPPGTVVVTAWTRLERFSGFDRAALVHFIDTWLGNRALAGR